MSDDETYNKMKALLDPKHLPRPEAEQMEFFNELRKLCLQHQVALGFASFRFMESGDAWDLRGGWTEEMMSFWVAKEGPDITGPASVGVMPTIFSGVQINEDTPWKQ